MNKPSVIRMARLVAALVFAVGLALGLTSSVAAVTPPTGDAIAKPADIVLHVPWQSGVPGYIRYTNYMDSELHVGPDAFAVDFDLQNKQAVIHPTAKGIVVYIGHWDTVHKPQGYGNEVYVAHVDTLPDSTSGTKVLVSHYAHMSAIYDWLQVGDIVDVPNALGWEGNTGTGAVHLHFSVWSCTGIKLGSKPSPVGCKAVVPEPLVGQDVYEGFNWWKNDASQLKAGTLIPLVGYMPPNLDDRTPPTGNWGSGASASDTKIASGQPVIYDVNFGDADSGVGEVRLTMYYPDWVARADRWDPHRLFSPAENWRIIARCDPASGGCDSTQWSLEWRRDTDKGYPNIEDGLLTVPWLPKANNAILNTNKAIDVCISFDVFDRAGNPIYAPGSVRCSIAAQGQASGLDSPQEAGVRLLTLLPFAAQSQWGATLLSGNGETTVQNPGASFSWSWTVKNTGTEAWGSGYRLVFQGGNQLGAPAAITVPATASGASALLALPFAAPTTEGRYSSNWHLQNPQGVSFGPTLSVNVQVGSAAAPVTDAISLVSIDAPAQVAPGQSFRPTVTVRVNSGQLRESAGDMLLNTDGSLFGAWPHVQVVGTVNPGQTHAFTFYADNPITAPTTPGAYESKWRVWRDGNWVGPEFTIRFQVVPGGGENRRPNAPTLTGPGDWAVYTSNQSFTLQAAATGDPDNDALTGYYFEMTGASSANSGWIASNSWSPSGLTPNKYEWRVKVRDARGAESDWSAQTWTLTLLTNEPQITSFYSTPCTANWNQGEPRKICFCSSTNAGTQRLMQNLAPDGSTNGEWVVINELGTPNYSCAAPTDNPPTWDPANVPYGTYRFRLYARRDGGWDAAAYSDIWVTTPYGGYTSYPPSLAFGGYGYGNADRRLPAQPAANSLFNTLAVSFSWPESHRATTYQLQANTASDFSGTMLLNQTIAAGTGDRALYTHTFDTDYANVFWRVTASGPSGSSTDGKSFVLDLTPPSTAVQPLAAAVPDSSVVVRWGGSDNRTGIRWYDVQVRDGDRPDAAWQDWLVNTTKTTEIFQGQLGHTYDFRARALDNAGNLEAWPASIDTTTRIDPLAFPPPAWWSTSYAHRRAITVLNNDSDTMPAGYPVGVRFTAATQPTAAEIYAASLSAQKGDDMRVVFGQTTELDRVVTSFTADVVEIWFPLQAALGGAQSNSVDYALYYGNGSASNPPRNTATVFMPKADANTIGLWHFQEGSGTAVADSSGRNHTGTFTNPGWGTGWTGVTGLFNGVNALVNVGAAADFNVSGGPMTLEAWVNLSQNQPNYPHLFSKWGNTEADAAYFLRITGDRTVQFVIRAPGGNRSLTTSLALALNTWYHVAATFDGATTMRLYINGIERGVSTSAAAGFAGSGPLYLGYAVNGADGGYFPGMIQHARISNVARTDFSYARVDVSPTVSAGLEQSPSLGAPQLAVLSVDSFADPSGGLLIQAVVQNQGTASTVNIVTTDLYLNHIPTGAGDLAGSVQFWSSSPIAAGSTVTLTTLIADVSALNAADVPLALPAGAEITATVYAQVDSTGVVPDADRSNNLSDGLQICMAQPDIYATAISQATAAWLTLTSPQVHNVTGTQQVVWVKFQAVAGKAYRLSTSDLGARADTILTLLGPDGVTILESNDDMDGLASVIKWTAPANGTYYATVEGWNPYIYGCGTSYTLTLVPAPDHVIFLPIVRR